VDPTGTRPGVGRPIDDLCRACKMPRRHTIVAVSGGSVARVCCDHCGSEHNYRGGAEGAGERPPRVAARELAFAGPVADDAGREEVDVEAHELERLLRRVIREEAGLTPVAPAERWRGGQLVLKPGRAGVQDKSWPIETFFHKVVMLRNRLRVLEQQINGAEISEETKLKLQGYITGCYGTLTSFNVLFAEEDDRFKGSGGAE
jgi:hypothetical protein